MLCVFVTVGFTHFQPSNYNPLLIAGSLRFFGAIPIALTAYGAWTAILAVAEEIEKPSRTIPK